MGRTAQHTEKNNLSINQLRVILRSDTDSLCLDTNSTKSLVKILSESHRKYPSDVSYNSYPEINNSYFNSIQRLSSFRSFYSKKSTKDYIFCLGFPFILYRISLELRKIRHSFYFITLLVLRINSLIFTISVKSYSLQIGFEFFRCFLFNWKTTHRNLNLKYKWTWARSWPLPRFFDRKNSMLKYNYCENLPH